MYSMVMMMALSGTAAVPAFGHGCHGGYSCSGYSGCTGYHGCSGCSGSCHGGHRLFGGHSHGCHGGYSCCGTVVVSSCCGCTGAPVMAPAGAPARPAQPAPAPAQKPASMNVAPAKVLVSLPVDATLTIDGQATVAQCASREFVSPALEAGKDYAYTIKVEIVRDGKSVSESKTVIVRAGETSEVSFGLAAVAAN